MMQCNLGGRPFELVGLAVPSIAESLVIARNSGTHPCCVRFFFSDELKPERLPFLSGHVRHTLQRFLTGKLARAFMGRFWFSGHM
jgi:hypothetical protein